MNAKPFASFFTAVFTAAACHASNVGLGTIEQPVNLGTESDPARIPLGAVATESNYNYGRGPVITAPRPSLHGALEWKSGIEINQNLASVFGIEVDNHDLPHSPATIRLKAYTPPAYSPHTRDQVLAATIHCILRSNSGRPKTPIQLKFTVDSPDDQALVTKYTKDYINAPDNQDDPPVESTPVPGTRLEKDSLGITWVVFPDIKSAAKDRRPPALIPFRLGGENAPEDPTWRLLPVWTGTGMDREKTLEVIGLPYPVFYDCFNPSTGSGPETNALFAGDPHGSVFKFGVTSTDASTDARILYPNTDTGTLAATILALVVSSQPTPERPLTVVMDTSADAAPRWLDDFKALPEWQLVHHQDDRISLKCSFVWDAADASLVKGAVPSAQVVRTTDGSLYVETVQKPAAPAEILPAETPEKSAGAIDR